jgi:hypothetical protein
MAYKGGVRNCNSILDGQFPLWLAVHEAGHLMARIQLVAAWNLAGLDNPSSFRVDPCLDRRAWQARRDLPLGLQRASLISVSGDHLGSGPGS